MLNQSNKGILCRAVGLLMSLALVGASCANAEDLNSLRGERVGWARLKTSSPYWKGHAVADPRLMKFFREQTTLNIDPTWYEADVENLDELSAYPLVFSQGIQTVTSDRATHNLSEYVRRGGFLLIDACINPSFRGNPDRFISDQIGALRRILPEARVVLLPKNHDIYTCLFKFTDGPPHTEDFEGWGDHGLYGVYIGSRMVGVISTSGLQCGWAGMKQVAGHDVRCMRMLVNIYVYAMLQGGAA
jgi:hypothetical protein